MDKAPGPDQGTQLIDRLGGREGTVFDKAAPTAPPEGAVQKRSIPGHLMNIIRFFEGVIADESLLLDLCVDRAIGIMEYNYKKRAVGSDLFESPSTANFVAMAAPVAVELYKQVLVAIGDRKDEYAKLLEEAQKELRDGTRTPPTILVP